MEKKPKKNSILKKFEKNEIIILAVASLLVIALLLSLLLAKEKRSLIDMRSEIARQAALIKDLEEQKEALQEKITTCQMRFVKKVEIKENADGGYSLWVRGKPFLVKGIGYNPVPIGEGYDHDFFANESKPWLIDGKLMQEAGINCVRIYSAGDDLTQVAECIRDLYENYGIYTIMSDWLGLWDYPRANYADSDFREKTKKRILKMVSALKNEEGLLMWVLGNENNYTFSGKIGFWTSPDIESLTDPRAKVQRRAEIYYTFVNELAAEIKKIDAVHPVALGNGEEQFLSTAAKKCDKVDLLAIIVYRGKKFGNLFNTIRNTFNKPILLSEFGCDSYNAFKKIEDQEIQAEFLLSQWKDIYKNTTLSQNQTGNILGGCLFEWNDEWWKHNEGYRDDWMLHNTDAGWSHGAYFFDIRAKNNLNMNEEWFGIVSLIEEKEGELNKRLPKKAYYTLKDYFPTISPQP